MANYGYLVFNPGFDAFYPYLAKSLRMSGYGPVWSVQVFRPCTRLEPNTDNQNQKEEKPSALICPSLHGGRRAPAYAGVICG